MGETVMHQASRQLEMIKLVSEHLTRSRVPHWLWGGWGVDFLAGRVTRPHADIDLLVRAENLDELRSCFGDLELSDDEPDPAKAAVRFTDGTVSIEVTLIEPDGDAVVTRGNDSDWTWPQGAFDRPRSRMGDVICPVISAAAMFEVKQHLADHPAGREPKEHDHHDMHVLQRIIAGEPA